MLCPENALDDSDNISSMSEGDVKGASMDDDEWVALLVSCARKIQRQWRCYRHHKTSEIQSVCCSCYVPISRTCELGLNQLDPVGLFCSPCKNRLRHGMSKNASPVCAVVPSPLPKLTQLLQTEAKYQDQLRLLRQQQELLQRQREEISIRKELEAESAVIERRLARQRRKQFQQLMAMKQEQESRRLQELESVSTTEKSKLKEDAKPRAKRKPHTAPNGQERLLSQPNAHLELTQLRHHRIPAPPLRSDDTAASKAAEIAEKAGQEYRRRQKLEMMKCYAQDLTPLVNGCKPKKLPPPIKLPPYPLAPPKKKLSVTSVKPSSIPSKIVQLEPIQTSTSKSNQSSNQLEGSHHADHRKHLAFKSVSPAKEAMSTPLTAEIKPASWMYDLLTSDPVLSNTSHSSSLSTAPVKPHTYSKTQLTTLHELEGDGDDTSRTSDSMNSQRLLLAPLPPASVPHVTATTAETYSSERLASLLQKYNVSITKTAGP